MVMMKKTQWIELHYNIRHTMVSFVAVILFVALATGLFTGIRWTGQALSDSVEADYLEEHHYHFKLNYPYGFDREFMDSLVANGIADEAEGYYETYRDLRLADSRYHVKVVSITQSIDRPCCVEGTLPAREGEAAVSRYWANRNGVQVGDIITMETCGTSAGSFLNAVLSEDMEQMLISGEKTDELITDTYRVTALVSSAEYMGKYSDTNGMSPFSPAPVGAVIYVAEQSFDPCAFCGYPRVVVRKNELNGFLTTSDAYRERSDLLESDIDAAVQDYAARKNAELQSAAGRMEELLRSIPGTEFHFGQVIDALQGIRDQGASTASRQMNASLAGLDTVMDTFRKMQYSLVSLFVIIGILVCYSTVSRLVYDQTVLIGTKKAIGFYKRDILKPFLIYSGIAAMLGSACGLLLGRLLIEPVMVNSVRDTYRFVRTVYYFGVRDAALFTLLQLVLILSTALTASVSVSQRPPLKLLTGEAATVRSQHRWLEKLPLWKRLPLMQKTIVRNCLNDRRRVFATLVGVMGCTTLVVCALSMYDNLVGSFDVNMEKVSRYDTIVYFSGEAETERALSTLLDENGISYAISYYSLGAIDQNVAGLYVPDDADFYKLFHLYDMEEGKEKQAEHGAWINIAYAENFGAAVGDTLCFTDASGQKHELPIEGIYDYYLINHQIILPQQLYEAEFGTDFVPNTFLLRTAGADFTAIAPTILTLEDGLSISDFYSGKKSTFDSIAVIARAVAAVYLVLSCVLAVLLLLNLFTMFVNEKKRELITLMINGFPRKKAEKYISGDTGFLTFIGIAAGLVLGVVMGGVSLDSFNNSATHFLNRVDWKACAIGAVYTAVLTFAMCRIALRKVRHFRLADINSM